MIQSWPEQITIIPSGREPTKEHRQNLWASRNALPGSLGRGQAPNARPERPMQGYDMTAQPMPFRLSNVTKY